MAAGRGFGMTLHRIRLYRHEPDSLFFPLDRNRRWIQNILENVFYNRLDKGSAMNRQQQAHQRSKVLHAAIASRLRTHPDLWDIPMQNLQRWKKVMHGLPAALGEWEALLQKSSRKKILELLESDSEEAYRLRSSSPFTGILTESERQRIFEMCRK